MSGGTINFSFLVGDKVRRKGSAIVGEVIEVTIGRFNVTYYVKWAIGQLTGHDADDLESAT